MDAALAELLEAIATLPPVGPWVTDAACRGQGDVFTSHPQSRAAQDLIRRTCLACPVIADCDRYSRRWPADGVWAGRWRSPTGDVTDVLEPSTTRASRVVCGTLGGYKRHRRQREPACQPCKAANAEAARYSRRAS